MDSLWIAYKSARNSYYAKLNISKNNSLRDTISECSGDSKKLYNLVSNLTTKSVGNPLSASNNDEELANSFTSFFEEKILTIRKQFKDIPQFQPEVADIPKLTKFHPMMEEQVELIINQMKTKSCELDPIPTAVLKKMMPVLKPAITRVVNLSLSHGCFHDD